MGQRVVEYKRVRWKKIQEEVRFLYVHKIEELDSSEMSTEMEKKVGVVERTLVWVNSCLFNSRREKRKILKV